MRYNRAVDATSQESANQETAIRGLVLVGPPGDRPCGIRDYVCRLEDAVAQVGSQVTPPGRPLQVTDYAGALHLAVAGKGSWDFLVHYERSRVPQPDYLFALSSALSGHAASAPSLKGGQDAPRSATPKFSPRENRSRLFVVPHEVYAEDPYAFPYAQVGGPWPLGAMRRWLYRRRHADWFREVELQRHGYYADGIFPLSRIAGDILHRRWEEGVSLREKSLDAPIKTLQENQKPPVIRVIPHARLEPYRLWPKTGSGNAESPGEAGTPAEAGTLTRSSALPRLGTRSEKESHGLAWLWGLAGFASASNDIEMILRALAALPAQGLVFFCGGSATGPQLPEKNSEKISELVVSLGLAERVFFRGYVDEQDWPETFAEVDGFVAPWKFRSASGSLFMALAAEKPVLVSDLPLAREIREEGADLILVAGGVTGWSQAMSRVAEGGLTDKGMGLALNATYPWSYPTVLREYLVAMRAFPA